MLTEHAHALTGYMEMTARQAREWAADVNQYVGDEEEVAARLAVAL